MKKLFFLLIPFFFLACASNNVTSAGGFEISRDNVLGRTKIIHEDLKPGMIWNLRDSITGEREHIYFSIINDKLKIGACYQFNRWAFITDAVFLANGERLVVPLKNRQTTIVKGKIVREEYINDIPADCIEPLKRMLSSECHIAFVGDNYVTDKLKIKDKVREALLATLSY